MSEVWVDLADAIEGLRESLTEAISRGKGQSLRFESGPVELTVQVGWKGSGSGKVGWKIIEVGGALESTATQTLKLALNPVMVESPSGPRIEPLIAGEVDNQSGTGSSESAELASPQPEVAVEDDA